MKEYFKRFGYGYNRDYFRGSKEEDLCRLMKYLSFDRGLDLQEMYSERAEIANQETKISFYVLQLLDDFLNGKSENKNIVRYEIGRIIDRARNGRDKVDYIRIMNDYENYIADMHNKGLTENSFTVPRRHEKIDKRRAIAEKKRRDFTELKSK